MEIDASPRSMSAIEGWVLPGLLAHWACVSALLLLCWATITVQSEQDVLRKVCMVAVLVKYCPVVFRLKG